MKNQYFGDNRDLFKYDLIFQIVKRGLVSHFIFIPMLTPDVSGDKTTKREGEQRNRCKSKAGRENNNLRIFLDKFQDKEKRDIRELVGFFKEQGIEMTIHQHSFCHEEREAYFREAERKLSPKSLIFVDPDIGLQVKRTRDKHIKYCEVKNLYDRMDTSSILMIYQHFPRNDKHESYLGWRPKDLKEKIVGDLPIHIDDNEIILFFLTKDNKSLRGLLGKEISKYGKYYGLRVKGI